MELKSPTELVVDPRTSGGSLVALARTSDGGSYFPLGLLSILGPISLAAGIVLAHYQQDPHL